MRLAKCIALIIFFIVGSGVAYSGIEYLQQQTLLVPKSTEEEWLCIEWKNETIRNGTAICEYHRGGVVKHPINISQQLCEGEVIVVNCPDCIYEWEHTGNNTIKWKWYREVCVREGRNCEKFPISKCGDVIGYIPNEEIRKTCEFLYFKLICEETRSVE